jgi:chorismate synthase
VARAFFKPISTQRRPLRSVDLETGEELDCTYIRSDTLVVPAGSVVAEAMVALVIAETCLEKFGGDHVDDTRAALEAYLERIPWRRPALQPALLRPPAPPAEALEPAEET